VELTLDDGGVTRAAHRLNRDTSTPRRVLFTRPLVNSPNYKMKGDRINQAPITALTQLKGRVCAMLNRSAARMRMTTPMPTLFHLAAVRSAKLSAQGEMTS
jgi:hypothetical protein